MRTIYGVKVLTEEDLFDTCGRPKNIMDFVKMNIEDTLESLKEARRDYWHESDFQNNEFKFSFIPIDAIENYVMYKTVEKSMGLARDYMVTNNGIEQSELIAEAAQHRINECMEYYSYNSDVILDSVCMVFIFDPRKDFVKDICVAIPNKIISKINAPMEYKCCECSFVEKSHSLPEHMLYSIVNNKVAYYCNKCARKHKYEFVPVGEEFNL